VDAVVLAGQDAVVIGVRVTAAVFADALHDAPVPSPVLRERAHAVVGSTVERARATGAVGSLVHVVEDGVTVFQLLATASHEASTYSIF
jgi:hypothetical protein